MVRAFSAREAQLKTKIRHSRRKNARLLAGLFCLPVFLKETTSLLLLSCLFRRSLLRCFLSWRLLCCLLCRRLLCRRLLGCCFLHCQRNTSFDGRFFAAGALLVADRFRGLSAAFRAFAALLRGRFRGGLFGRSFFRSLLLGLFSLLFWSPEAWRRSFWRPPFWPGPSRVGAPPERLQAG